MADGNYKHLERFIQRDTVDLLPADRFPGDKLNISLVWREDLAFVDSASETGVQAADLLASGLRAFLRGQFSDNREAGNRLAATMVEGTDENPGLRLVMLSDLGKVKLPIEVAERVLQLDRAAKRMLVADTW